ncbi:ankyrin repeat domain-containing protein [Endozoicomonas sp. ONNA2]|uniref:ankyrin repeat domain-containing protein n=1 Tax=Endozoicomonas sp. ONNA2 TaxID=2828741 RepID=UPI002148C06D|nr:ankyrin repeat domain-containing protein [Endozoicomonas sp. ONNA2]
MDATSRISGFPESGPCAFCTDTARKGQLGKHLLVKTGCKNHPACHLDCLYDYLKPGKSLNERSCRCGPSMPLLKDPNSLLDNVCQTKDLNPEALEMWLKLKPGGNCTTALEAIAVAAADAAATSKDDLDRYTQCFMTLTKAIQSHVDEHKRVCTPLAMVTGGVAAGFTTIKAAVVSAKVVALCAIVGEIANMCITGFPKGAVMCAVGSAYLAYSWGISACPPYISECISLVLGVTTTYLFYLAGQKIAGKMGNSICLENGNTPLHIATQKGPFECVKEVIDLWFRNQNTMDIIMSALWKSPYFFARGIIEYVKELFKDPSISYEKLIHLNHSWNINTANKDGYTALHFAVLKNREKCLGALINNGANVNARKNDGKTPLHIAAAQHIADKKSDCANCLDKLLDNDGVDINTTDSSGCTALHVAAESGCAESIKKLKDNGIDVNKKNNKGATALHLALQLTDEKNSVKCMELLIKAGAVVNARKNDGKTPLHIAVEGGHTKCLKKLLDNGVDINTTDSSGWSALHVAAESGCAESIKKLLKKNGIDVNKKTNKGATALHFAAKQSFADLVKALLAAPQHIKVKVNEKNNSWQTALHLAARDGCAESVKALLGAQGIEVNKKDNDGNTALHFAASKGDIVSVKALLDADGIQVNVKNNKDLTALDLANKHGNTECEELLRNKKEELLRKKENEAHYQSGCLIQ